MRFQLAQYKTFCNTPTPSPTDDWSTIREQKLTKDCFLPPRHRFSARRPQYQYWKANKYSILTVTELGPPVLKSSTRIWKFYTPTNSELKFYKSRIENWLPIGFNLRSFWWEPTVKTSTLCSTANGLSLKVLYTDSWSREITLKTFHFFRTLQVFLNPTPTTQSTIKPQQNKSQPPSAQSSTNAPHALNYATPIAIGVSGSSERKS